MNHDTDLWAMNMNILFLMSAMIPTMSFESEEVVAKRLDKSMIHDEKPVTKEE